MSCTYCNFCIVNMCSPLCGTFAVNDVNQKYQMCAIMPQRWLLILIVDLFKEDFHFCLLLLVGGCLC